MKITYGDLDNVMTAFQNMDTLTGRAGYAVMRNEKLLRDDYQILVDMRNKMIRKYAPDGSDRILITDPGFKDFEKEYLELLQNSVEFEPYTIAPEEYDVDNIYCEKASPKDYEIVEAIIVKKESAG